MPVKNAIFLIITLNVFAMCYACVSWASPSTSRQPSGLPPAYKQGAFSDQQKKATGSGKITGKVTNTKGAPLSDITISIQVHTEEATYNDSFDDVAVTDKKGKFTADNIDAGVYVVRASSSSDESYLPNDKFHVAVKAKKTKKIKLTLSAATPSGSEYVGSATCLSCHQEQKAWEDTAHAKTISTPSSETVVAPFDGDNITTSDGKVKFKPFIENGEYKITLYDLEDEAVSVTYTIARTHGGVATVGKQRYQVEIGSSHYILPVQYNNRNVDESEPNDAWVSYSPENWYSDASLITTDLDTAPNKNKSFEQNCEGCHVTGLSITQNAGGEFVSGSKELGVSCESCHGPGSQHVSAGGGKAKYTVNPGYLATDRGNEVCGQCHIRVKNKTGENGADFVTEYPCIISGSEITPYIPGRMLADYIEETGSDGKPTAGYWNDNNSSLGESASDNNHSKKHHQQYQDLLKSSHYKHAGSKCYTCHEPHGAGVSGTAQLLKQSNNNKLCLGCHRELAKTMKSGDGVQNKHAKHACNSSDVGGSLCTGCHMPKTAKTAVDNDISSHVFDIIKPSTSKAMADANTAAGTTNSPGVVITNSCYGCHSDEDDDYSVERWEEWENEED